MAADRQADRTARLDIATAIPDIHTSAGWSGIPIDLETESCN
jgi:hypothetical protein